MRVQSRFSRPQPWPVSVSQSGESSDRHEENKRILSLTRTSENANPCSARVGNRLDLLSVPYLLFLFSGFGYTCRFRGGSRFRRFSRGGLLGFFARDCGKGRLLLFFWPFRSACRGC